jgi:PIN domain nuclease of toxin-antitoxin system
LSVLSFWEVVLKSTRGKLDVGDLREWWQETLGQLAASPLLLRPEHISEVSRLPGLHGDPFNRALIAQARVETLGFVTTYGTVARYAGKSFQVVV